MIDCSRTMPTLTVFTPTYNRAYTLHLCYESLCRQTNKDFCWLVIDDGSTDNTRELVEGWKKEDKIPITYFYQENQGMHGAHNAAYRLIDTELNICIDSDDYMPDDAVEMIVSFWKVRGSNQYAGMVGLDKSINGELISVPFPKTMPSTTLVDYEQTIGYGDTKMVLRTDVVRQYPEYPRFDGERYFSLGYLYLLIDQDYQLLTLNVPLVIVDYKTDGSSMGMWKQYWNNPRGFLFLRKEHIRLYKRMRYRIKESIHYYSHCFRIGDISNFYDSQLPIWTVFALPFGLFLYLLTKYKVYRGDRMTFFLKSC